MPTFTPPLLNDRPTFLPNSNAQQIGLWRHYANRTRGVDVFALSDGTFAQETATPENGNTAVPYPWDFNNPSGPYVYITNFDGSITSISHEGGTGTESDGTPWIVFRYAGGSSYQVTTAQATALTNYTAHGIGYAGCLT